MANNFGRKAILSLVNKLSRKIPISGQRKSCPSNFMVGIDVGIAESRVKYAGWNKVILADLRTLLQRYYPIWIWLWPLKVFLAGTNKVLYIYIYKRYIYIYIYTEKFMSEYRDYAMYVWIYRVGIYSFMWKFAMTESFI